MLTSVQTASAEAWQGKQAAPPSSSHEDDDEYKRYRLKSAPFVVVVIVDEDGGGEETLCGHYDHTTHANRTSGMKMHTPTVSARSLHFRVYLSHQQPNFVVDDDNTHDSARAIRQTVVVRNGPLPDPPTIVNRFSVTFLNVKSQIPNSKFQIVRRYSVILENVNCQMVPMGYTIWSVRRSFEM